MLIRIGYFSKLFLICVLVAFMFSLVEVAFDRPFLFAALSILSTLFIRLLWLSAARDEKHLRLGRYGISRRAAPTQKHETDRAA